MPTPQPPMLMTFEKVTTLPTLLKKDTVYMVAAGEGFDLFVSDSEGTTARPMNQADGGIEPFLLMGAK